MRALVAIAVALLATPLYAQQTQTSVQTAINTNITTNGANQITGAKLNGVLTVMNGAIFQPSTTSFSLMGSVNPMQSPYNAKCNGVADDATAFQGALNAIASGIYGELLIPASASGCLINSLLTYNTSSGPIQIYGEGPNSKILAGSSAGGIQITGSCGLGADRAYLKNFSVSNVSGGTSAFGIQLNGTAVYGMDDVSVIAGANPFTAGISGLGAQQGYIHGGFSSGNTKGIVLNNCSPGVSSNGVDISGGRSFNDVTAAVDIEGAASDVWVHNVNIVNSTTGIINNQSGAAGPNYVSNVHLEDNATFGVDVQAGSLVIEGNNDYNAASLKAHPGAVVTANSSLFSGTIVFDSGSSGALTNSTINAAITDNTSGGLFQYNNVGSERPANPTNFNSAGSFTSQAASAGDILTLRPNPSVGGAWGVTINGAGASSDVYLRLANVIWAGSTATGSMTLKSGVAGATWATFTSSGLTIPGNTIGAGSAITSSGPGGALTAPAFVSGSVSCAANTVSLTTLVVTNGVVTHC